MQRSGNTFRVIMRALLKASEGNDVIVVSKDHAMSELKADIARRVMREFGYLEKDKGTRAAIRFVNGNTIYFVGERDLLPSESVYRLRGVSESAPVIFDV